MNNSLRLVTLGGLAIFRGEEPITVWASRKASALLVYLACNPRLHSREVLADLFWDGRTQRRAMSNLRVVLSSLRQQVGEFVDITRDQAGINLDAAVWLDTRELETAVKQSLTFETIGVMETAVSLYQGEFLEGFYLRDSSRFEEWMLTERERLHRLTVTGLRILIDWYLTHDQIEMGLPRAEELLQLDPLLEDGHRQLMVFLALSGQRSQALAQYEKCCQLLQEELGILPSPETVKYAQKIREGILDKDYSPPATAPTEETIPPRNIPTQATPFIGREHELDALAAMVTDPNCRLVTIVGPGGMGKTRLALALAERLMSVPQLNRLGATFSDGIFFVLMDSLVTTEEVVPAIAKAIGISDWEEEKDARHRQLLYVLKRKRLLLVLDNFEHLIDCAPLLVELLHNAPHVQLLVISRTRLNLLVEHLFPLGGLPYGDRVVLQEAEMSQAERLFVQSARRIQPNFVMQENGDFHHLNRICQLVDGLPLAIELAAGWVNLLSLSEIADEIGRGLEILETEIQDIPARHRSMQALLNSTWRRLDAVEQQVLARLSVFRGGFSRQAAQAVTGVSLRHLTRLVNQSLIQVKFELKRYQLHPLLNQFAAEQLSAADEQAALEAHCNYYCAFLNRLEDKLRIHEQAAIESIEVDLPNVRTAWHHAVANKLLVNLDNAANSLAWFLVSTDRTFELDSIYKPTIENLVDINILPEAKLVSAKLQKFATWNEYSDKAILHLKQSLEYLDEVEAMGLDICIDRAFLLRRLAEEFRYKGYKKTQNWFLESYKLFHLAGDKLGMAEGLWCLAQMDDQSGNYTIAIKRYKDAYDLFKSMGATRLSIRVQIELGGALLSAYEIEAGDLHIQEALKESYNINDPRLLSQNLYRTGCVLNRIGRFQEACQVFNESSLISNDLYECEQKKWRRIMQIEAVYHKGLALLFNGYNDLALKQAKLCISLAEEIVPVALMIDGWLLMGLGKIAEECYGDARYWLSKCTEQKIILWSRVFAGLTYACLSFVAIQENEEEKARGFLRESLRATVEQRDFLGLMIGTLPVAATWFVYQNHIKRSVELYTMASQHPIITTSVWHTNTFEKLILPTSIKLLQNEVLIVQGRDRELDPWETAESLLDELSQSN